MISGVSRARTGKVPVSQSILRFPEVSRSVWTEAPPDQPEPGRAEWKAIPYRLPHTAARITKAHALRSRHREPRPVAKYAEAGGEERAVRRVVAGMLGERRRRAFSAPACKRLPAACLLSGRRATARRSTPGITIVKNFMILKAIRGALRPRAFSAGMSRAGGSQAWAP